MNINEYKKVLEVVDIPQGLKEKLEDIFTKFNNFNEYIKETLNISEETATMRSEIFMKQRCEELLDEKWIENCKNENEAQLYFTDKICEAFKDYLEYEKYDTLLSDELVECFKFIMEIQLAAK
jgi:hypothetical protein